MSQIRLFQGNNGHMTYMVHHMIIQNIHKKSVSDDTMDTSEAVTIGNSERQLCFSLFSKFIKEVGRTMPVAMVTQQPIGSSEDEAIQEG